MSHSSTPTSIRSGGSDELQNGAIEGLASRPAHEDTAFATYATLASNMNNNLNTNTADVDVSQPQQLLRKQMMMAALMQMRVEVPNGAGAGPNNQNRGGMGLGMAGNNSANNGRGTTASSPSVNGLSPLTATSDAGLSNALSIGDPFNSSSPLPTISSSAVPSPSSLQHLALAGTGAPTALTGRMGRFEVPIVGPPSPLQPNQKPLPSPAKFKTQICRNILREGFCKFGSRCGFAHTVAELRNVDQAASAVQSLIVRDHQRQGAQVAAQPSASLPAPSLMRTSPLPIQQQPQANGGVKSDGAEGFSNLRISTAAVAAAAADEGGNASGALTGDALLAIRELTARIESLERDLAMVLPILQALFNFPLPQNP